MASFTPWRRMLYRLCHVHETSPGTHTLFPTYTCPVYCWRSVQLLDFGLCCNLIHASQPVRTTFTGQWFASGFLQTPPHGDALAIGCTLPTAGRVRDFHPLERAPAGHTRKRPRPAVSWSRSKAFARTRSRRLKICVPRGLGGFPSTSAWGYLDSHRHRLRTSFLKK